MKVSEAMSSPVVTCEPDDTLRTVLDIFNSCPLHHLVVVENKQLCGLISARDLFKALSPKIGKISATSSDLATLNKRVNQVMTHKVYTLAPDEQLIEAVRLMYKHGFSCVPVVNNHNVPIGIVTSRDILHLLIVRHDAKDSDES